MADRALPWTKVAEALGTERFGDIRGALEVGGTDALDRDAFLLNGVVGTLLRELMPPGAPAEAVTAYGAILHAMYVLWSRDWPVTTVDAGALKAAIGSDVADRPAARPPVPFAGYLQLPENLVWAEPVRGAPHEPVDGVFLIADDNRARALAILGFRPEREGFTTAEAVASLPLPPATARLDESAPFASLLPGGERAGLISLADETELVRLALLALSVAQR